MSQEAETQKDGTRAALTLISERLREIREGKLVPALTEYEREGDRISVRITTGGEATPKTVSKKSSR